MNSDKNTIECSCEKLHNYYYAIITDTTKEIVDPEKPEPEKVKPVSPVAPVRSKVTLEDVEKRDQVLYILLLIVIPLGVLGLLLPCYLVR